MKDILLFVVLAIVVVAGVWYYYDTYVHPSVSEVAATTPVVEPPPPPPKKVAARPRPKPIEEPKIEPAEIKPAPAAAPVVVASSKPARPPKPVRTVEPESITAGTRVTQVIELLGPPDLKAATTDRGSLVETYFYTTASGQDVDLVHLRGGRVEP
jgi:outer membrane biosynthesis protein TonB